MQWSVTRKNNKKNKKQRETQRSGAKWSKAPMGPPLNLHPNPTKKNQKTRNCSIGRAAGAQRDATLCRHSREDGDRYQAGRVWGPSQSETWAAERRGFHSFNLFSFFCFSSSRIGGISWGLFWGKSAACVAAPASSGPATDNKQIG